MQGKNKKFQMFILYTQKMRLINNIYTHSKKKPHLSEWKKINEARLSRTLNLFHAEPIYLF